MPYIEKGKRSEMDKVVDKMTSCDVRADGRLNYVLFKFCKKTVPPGYQNYKNFCGELRQCATEIERRLLAGYEDVKIKENGDVE